MKFFSTKILCLTFSFIFVTVSFSSEIVIPNIKNKQSITVVVEKGHWTKYLKEKLVPYFTKETQVPVKIVEVSLSNMYQLQEQSLEKALGNFDVLSLEAGWAKEWAAKGYTVSLSELAKDYNRKKSNWNSYLQSFYPSLFEILSYNKQLHSIPYNTYVMANHYRLDLFENKLEQSAFERKYGYKLSPPKTLAELKDIAKFFTRKKGELLKGKKLSKDFYGVALMSGNKPHINDEWSSILWSLGGVWFQPNYKNNKLTNFFLPQDLSRIKQAANYYLALMKYAFPTNKEFAFFESAEALASGNVAMWPFAYNNLWAVSSQLKSDDKEQKFSIATTPGGKPYHGAYAFSVAYDSNNPEAAFWFLRFMTSMKGQIEYAIGGGNPTRIDVNDYLTSKLNNRSPQFYSLKTTYEANTLWNNQIQYYGHYMSTAMGIIYPLLTKYTYLISNKDISIDKGIEQLLKEIRDAQNRYGEKAMFGQ